MSHPELCQETICGASNRPDLCLCGVFCALRSISLSIIKQWKYFLIRESKDKLLSAFVHLNDPYVALRLCHENG